MSSDQPQRSPAGEDPGRVSDTTQNKIDIPQELLNRHDQLKAAARKLMREVGYDTQPMEELKSKCMAALAELKRLRSCPINDRSKLHRFKGGLDFVRARMDEIEALEEEIFADVTRDPLDALSYLNRALKDENWALWNKKRALKVKNRAWRDKKRALKVKIRALKDKNRASRNEKRALKVKIRALKVENRALRDKKRTSLKKPRNRNDETQG
ncbi:hypothetical protein KC343_g1249 [Hortaea werneckii]|nr:hypothetical protein KC352_g10397 [Hortaea werneckii]KAI7567983.1 hypothetical protein KC317_g4600 [Hortaea werneckii]KAI7620211.1 hypothetical protein KC346_g4230 [Hortaea werneckii]KAI7636533.1 hypothetical protein KC343_g1249 [Hortaea werneckii]KAI7682161.1 hypothetical protein KC319_g1171 [Hortaea werneckii]